MKKIITASLVLTFCTNIYSMPEAYKGRTENNDSMPAFYDMPSLIPVLKERNISRELEIDRLKLENTQLASRLKEALQINTQLNSQLEKTLQINIQQQQDNKMLLMLLLKLCEELSDTNPLKIQAKLIAAQMNIRYLQNNLMSQF